MSKHKRLLATAGLLMAGMLAATGCAPGVQDKSMTAQSANEPKELKYLYFTDGPDQAATEKLIKQFETKTRAKVSLEIIPFANLDSTLQARLAGGNAPDVARLSNLAPFKRDMLDLNQTQKDALEGTFIDGAKAYTHGAKGELLAVPSDLTMNGPLINVELFKKAGVDVPTKARPWKSWSEMIEAATKVKAATNTEYALAMDVSGHRFSTMLSQYGTTLFSEDGKSVAFDEKKAASAIKQFVDLNNSGAMPKDLFLSAGSKYKAANDIFKAGQVPVYLSGNWQVAAFNKDVKFEWAAVPNPCQERCGGFPGGKFMAAFKQTKSPRLAAEFIAFMNSAEAQTTMAQDANFLPTRKDLISSGIKYHTRAADMDVFLADIAKTPNDTYSTTYSPAFSGTAAEIIKQVGRALQNQATPEEAAAAIKQAADKNLRDAAKQ